MKYQVGDKTLLGEIARTGINPKGDTVYIVDLSNDAFDRTVAFEEAIIDKIIIKPKRNIDHLIELWESGKAYEAPRMTADILASNGLTRSVMEHLMKPYSKPSRYPKLTPEELRAVKWLVDGGFEALKVDGSGTYATYGDLREMRYVSLKINPITRGMNNATWITESPINLRELLAAQEGV